MKVYNQPQSSSFCPTVLFLGFSKTTFWHQRHLKDSFSAIGVGP